MLIPVVRMWVQCMRMSFVFVSEPVTGVIFILVMRMRMPCMRMGFGDVYVFWWWGAYSPFAIAGLLVCCGACRRLFGSVLCPVVWCVVLKGSAGEYRSLLPPVVVRC